MSSPLLRDVYTAAALKAQDNPDIHVARAETSKRVWFFKVTIVSITVLCRIGNEMCGWSGEASQTTDSPVTVRQGSLAGRNALLKMIGVA